MLSRGIWIWLVLALGLGFGLFQLKYRVQGLEAKLAHINRQILESEESIHVLKAEWSYLNQPDRIEALARKHLALEPLTGRQYGTIDDLPLRNTDLAEPGGAGGSAPHAPAIPRPTERPSGPQGGGVTLARDVR